MNPSYNMNEKITIQELANTLSEKHGMNKKEAELFIKGVFELIEEALATEKYVKVKGLGIFKLTEVDTRESININTGERFEIQGHTKISFTPETSLKELINKPFSHFETVVLNDGVMLETTEEEIVESPEEPQEANETTEAIMEETGETIESIEETPDEKGETELSETATEEPSFEEKAKEEEKEKEEEVIPATEEGAIEVEEETADEEALNEEVATEEVEEAEENDATDEEEVATEEEAIATEEETKEVEEEKGKEAEVKPTDEAEEEKTSKSLVFITILLILIILGGAYWMFRPAEESTQLPTTEEPVEVTDTIKRADDTLPSKDIPAKTTTETSEAKIVPTEEKVASLADTTDYVIVGTKDTYTLQNGETLIRVALKYYGSKNFWPYIAKHNEKTIKNPNNVSKGTKLLIPELVPKK